MTNITLHCETCHTAHELPKTPEIPEHIFVLHCNWCPKCEDQAQDYYEEWWDDNDDGNNGNPVPQPVPDNQLCIPFIFDELQINQMPEKENA
jgi:hypothetical protein